MEGLRVDKTYFLALQEMVASGEMSEDGLRRHMYGQMNVPLAIDQLLEDGEGELTEEDCDRIGTELPPGLYQYIRVTDDENKPRVLGTFYMRTVDGVLDELWLAAARTGMPPNPVDVVPKTPSFSPFLIGEAAPQPRTDHGRTESMPTWPDATGSQGVRGKRPTQMVKLIEDPEHDHRWQFLTCDWEVRSTKLAPVLLLLREKGCRKVPLSLLRQAVDRHQGALKGAHADKGVR